MWFKSCPSKIHFSLIVAATVFALVACSGPKGETEQGNPPGDGANASAGEQASGHELYNSFSTDRQLFEPWTGDLDGMVERGFVRVLVVYSKTNYFLDGGTQRGITYEALREFEKVLNQKFKRKTVKINVVIVPVRRDELLPALVEGRGDIAAANLTITPERLETVDFSIPLASGVNELVITGPNAPMVDSEQRLAGMEIHVRRSSSYWESLQALNLDFTSRGLDPVRVVEASEFLEDEDLLEMVHAGLIPAMIMDSHKAHLWSQVFDDIVVHQDVAIRTGGEIGWAFRKNSPQLAEIVNTFGKGHKKGSLFGNVLLKRYFEDNKWVKNPHEEEDRQRFVSMVQLFKTYGEKYDFDFLMLAALAYQESRLIQSTRSHAGAIGVMQILPSTATDPNVNIPDIHELENNIHAGTKYLQFLKERYFSDDDIDRINQELLAFAAYNAGPARVRALRSEAEKIDLDPNQWFGNVEVVAARRIGRETVQYVSNISKYYIAYQQVITQLEYKDRAKNHG